MAHLLAAAGPAASPGPFTAPLGLGLPLPGLTFSVWTQVTMEPPWRAGGMTRTGWARVPTGRSCRWGFSEPRGPSRCRPNSLSMWADSAQAPLWDRPCGMGPGHGAQETRASVDWPGTRPVAAGPTLPLCQLSSHGAHSSRGRSLAMHFPENVGGISKSCGPPTSPLVLALGSFTPPSGREGHIVHHQIQEPRAMGNILARLLSEEAPRSPASVVPPSRWVSPPFRTAVFHHGAACLAPCLTGTATPPQPDCQQFPRQANPRNIFNNLLQILPAYSGRTLPQTQTLKCHLPAPGTASPNTQFHLEIF